MVVKGYGVVINFRGEGTENLRLNVIMVKYIPLSYTMPTVYLKPQFACYIHNSGINRLLVIIQNLMENIAPPSPNNAPSTGTKRGISVPCLGTQAPTPDTYVTR